MKAEYRSCPLARLENIFEPPNCWACFVRGRYYLQTATNAAEGQPKAFSSPLKTSRNNCFGGNIIADLLSGCLPVDRMDAAKAHFGIIQPRLSAAYRPGPPHLSGLACQLLPRILDGTESRKFAGKMSAPLPNVAMCHRYKKGGIRHSCHFLRFPVFQDTFLKYSTLV